MLQDNEQLIRKMRRVLSFYRRSCADPAGQNNPPGAPAQGFGRILSLLHREGDGLPQADLAKKLDIRPQSLSEALTSMEEKKWIERRPDPGDKRKTRVFLTDGGREHERAMAENRRITADRILSCLSEQEKTELAALLEKILSEEPSEK